MWIVEWIVEMPRNKDGLDNESYFSQLIISSRELSCESNISYMLISDIRKRIKLLTKLWSFDNNSVLIVPNHFQNDIRIIKHVLISKLNDILQPYHQSKSQENSNYIWCIFSIFDSAVEVVSIVDVTKKWKSIKKIQVCIDGIDVLFTERQFWILSQLFFLDKQDFSLDLISCKRLKKLLLASGITNLVEKLDEL